MRWGGVLAAVLWGVLGEVATDALAVGGQPGQRRRLRSLPTRRRAERDVVAPGSSDDDDDDDDDVDAAPTTRSSFESEYEERFAAGAEDRRSRLHRALEAAGFDEVDQLLNGSEFRGSAALRTYTSFIYPKSAGALATAERPQRAASIAEAIVFHAREKRAADHAWLRNVDRARASDRGRNSSDSFSPLYVILDNVRSAHNVGNIFRAAEAARVAELITCGITPKPPDSKLLKTAVGSATDVPHRHFASTLDALAALRANNVTVWALETAANARNYTDIIDWPRPLALVLGNEVIGVDTRVLDAADAVVQVPMHGRKNSLNVATCATIVMWDALRRWDAQPGGGASS